MLKAANVKHLREGKRPERTSKGQGKGKGLGIMRHARSLPTSFLRDAMRTVLLCILRSARAEVSMHA